MYMTRKSMFPIILLTLLKRDLQVSCYIICSNIIISIIIIIINMCMTVDHHLIVLSILHPWSHCVHGIDDQLYTYYTSMMIYNSLPCTNYCYGIVVIEIYKYCICQ